MCQSLAEDAFGELEDRHSSCGGERTQQYPFTVGQRILAKRPDGKAQVYTFLLMLSNYGTKAGPRGTYGERIFEDLCCHAAKGYLGGKEGGAEAAQFGFPRRILPRDFPAALQKLSCQVGDFTPNTEAPRSKRQKDAKLDIVAWRPFPDRRPGKLIGLGQCAAGRSDFAAKTQELQIEGFFKKWLREVPSVNPVRMFFVPWRVPSADFRTVCIDCGILFDRCRISCFCSDIDSSLRDQCQEWSRHAFESKFLQ